MTTGRGLHSLDVAPDGRSLITTPREGGADQFFDAERWESLGRVPATTRVVHGVPVSPDRHYAFGSVAEIGTEPGNVDIFDHDIRARR